MRLLWLVPVLFTGCIASRGGALALPTRTDVASVHAGGDGSQGGLRVASGLSAASLSSKAGTRDDIVVGYFGETRTGNESSARQALRVKQDDAPPRELVHGPFVEIGRRLWGTRHRRLWVGARLELAIAERAGATDLGLGTASRVGWELFAASKSKGSGGLWHGAAGLGVFAELGSRRFSHGSETIMALGFTGRLPFAVIAK